jgi:uncharacterized protein
LPEDKRDDQRTFWGPLGTILWSVVIALIFVATQTVVVIIYIIMNNVVLPSGVSSPMARLQYDGVLLSICTFAAAVTGSSMTIIAVKLKHGSDLKTCLGITLPNKRQFFQWFVAIGVFILVSDCVSFFLGKPIVPEFMARTYGSLESPWMLSLALLLAAPLFEELFFRGFLIKGLSASILRWYGAVIFSSAAWATIHQQYDLYGITTIFALGLILGTARVKTGSTILAMFLHSFCSLVAIAETIIYLHRLFG